MQYRQVVVICYANQRNNILNFKRNDNKPFITNTTISEDNQFLFLEFNEDVMGYSYDQEVNRGYRKLSSNDFKIESSSDGGDNWNTISGLKFERVNSKKIKFSDFSNFNGSDIIKVTPKSNKVFEFIVRNHQENNSLPQSCDENTQVNNIVNVNYVSLSTISNYNLFYINNSNAIFKEKRINIIKNENKIVSN